MDYTPFEALVVAISDCTTSFVVLFFYFKNWHFPEKPEATPHL